MARNRYVYCLCEAAIVVASKRGEGGTWAGAVENLKQGWTPLWTRVVPDAESGNAELVRRGAHRLPEGNLDLEALLAAPGGRIRRHPAMQELFERSPALTAPDDGSEAGATPATPTADGQVAPANQAATSQMSFFDLFLQRMQALTMREPLSLKELSGMMDVGKPQLRAWLARAVHDGHVRKLGRPVRYQWGESQPRQGSMFDDGR
jgi:predicted Rossmann fold nucleotide-binding protein DprA/Smf involved in DNA uptake